MGEGERLNGRSGEKLNGTSRGRLRGELEETKGEGKGGCEQFSNL